MVSVETEVVNECDATVRIKMPDGCVVSISSPCGSDPVAATIAALAAMAYVRNFDDVGSTDADDESVQPLMIVVQSQHEEIDDFSDK